MNKPTVVVIDYGIGNIFSVTRALESCGAEVLLSSDPRQIDAANRLVLPGVGAFSDGMQGLRDRNLVEPIRAYARSGRPLLGICLGMQMLATVSEEFGVHEGLGLIEGKVRAVPATTSEEIPQKIPHIGWASLLRPVARQTWDSSILEDTPEGTAVYLVHSFAVEPTDPGHRLADCDYGGHALCAALQRGQVYGCQFHPEKSGPAGLRILSRFLACPTQ